MERPWAAGVGRPGAAVATGGDEGASRVSSTNTSGHSSRASLGSEDEIAGAGVAADSRGLTVPVWSRIVAVRLTS